MNIDFSSRQNSISYFDSLSKYLLDPHSDIVSCVESIFNSIKFLSSLDFQHFN